MKKTPQDQAAEFDLEGHIPYLLVRSANQIGVITQKRYQETIPEGLKLSLRESRTLLIVAVRGVIAPAAVADATGMDRSTITRAIATLRDKGFLIETRNGEDRRAKLLELTDAGRELSNQILPQMQVYSDMMETMFSKEEITQFTTMLDRLVRLFAQPPSK